MHSQHSLEPDNPKLEDRQELIYSGAFNDSSLGAELPSFDFQCLDFWKDNTTFEGIQ